MIAAPSYRALLRVPGFPALLAGTLLARTALQMLAITLVLFVLGAYRSPTLAGLASFLWVFPALLVSPLAGALLDRYGRVRMIVVDYTVQVATFALIGGLSLSGRLPPALLLVIVGIGSLTGILSITGGRTLFPLLVPEPLWERANALDSQGYVVATLVGPPAAGFLVGALGGAWALIACTSVVAAGALAMWLVPDPALEPAPGSLLANAAAGVRYVLASASLRGLAITLTVLNLGFGIMQIALPVLLLGRLHQPPVVVGIAYAVMGVAGLTTGLASGRFDSRDRERQIITVMNAISALGLAVLALATNLWLVFLAMAVIGAATGPSDVAMFTLRQRRTNRAWYGRAFAVSMSLNYSGQPIGAAVAGPLIGVSLLVALWAGAAITAASTLLPITLIPRQEN